MDGYRQIGEVMRPGDPLPPGDALDRVVAMLDLVMAMVALLDGVEDIRDAPDPSMPDTDWRITQGVAEEIEDLLEEHIGDFRKIVLDMQGGTGQYG